MAISLEQWRALMGDRANGLSDAEVLRDRDTFYAAGRMFLSVYAEHCKTRRQARAADRREPVLTEHGR